MECIFILKYDVGEQRCDPDALVERLGAVGCTDALVGTGEAVNLPHQNGRQEAVRQAACFSLLA